jgi:hypothetical protein
MKQPRPDAFDPRAKERRTLISSLDNFPAIEQPGRPDLPGRVDREQSPAPILATTSPMSTPGKRVMRNRHSFDIYQDQYESLTQLALEERQRGGQGSTSAMVREALDDFIAKRKQAQPPNDTPAQTQ